MKFNLKNSAAANKKKKKAQADADAQTEGKVDPLYTIFEKHLYDFEKSEKDGSQDDFLNAVVADYLGYLTSKQVVIPYKWKSYIAEELFEQAKQMLVKKTYGCLSIKEFVSNQKDIEKLKNTAKRRYSKLGR